MIFARTLVLMALMVGATAAGTQSPAAGEAQPGAVDWKVGAAAVKITPSLQRPVYIAGYNNNRIADAVHDDLWARALVLDDGHTRFAVVACDLIGLSNYRVQQIRKRVKSVPPERVLITCTHVHSGPDTLGLWGRNSLSTGLDPLYMDRLEARIAAAVESAAATLRPARLEAGTVTVPDGLVHNSREQIQDKELTALRFATPVGETIATVVHYGGHPEVNKSKSLTSDFVHYVRDAAEQRFGGVCLFLNGALGGMVTPHIREHTLAEMQRVGEGVGRAAVQALEQAAPLRTTPIRIGRRDLRLPMENSGFQLLIAGKVLDGEAVDGMVPTEVWRVDLGPVCWVTIPGEILPRPALALKALMPGRYRMVIALGNDELGYILDPTDFDRQLYSYEKSMSVGRQTWPLLFQAARDLLGKQ